MCIMATVATIPVAVAMAMMTTATIIMILTIIVATVCSAYFYCSDQ